MGEKLPLDSPLWLELSACYSAGDAVAQLWEVVARRLGAAWEAPAPAHLGAGCRDRGRIRRGRGP